MVAISVLLHPVQPGRVARPRRGLSLISAALLYRYRHGDDRRDVRLTWTSRIVRRAWTSRRRAVPWLRGRRMDTPRAGRGTMHVMRARRPGAGGRGPVLRAARRRRPAVLASPPDRGDCRSLEALGTASAGTGKHAEQKSTESLDGGNARAATGIMEWRLRWGRVQPCKPRVGPAQSRAQPDSTPVAEGVAWVRLPLSLLRNNACCVRVVGISRC